MEKIDMKSTPSLTAERLRELLHYDPETGVFTWRVVTGNQMTAGQRAGYVALNGYTRITIDQKSYAAHQLAWLHVRGEWPARGIDHINRVRSDNRIANLRVAVPSENQQNTRVRVDNRSGHKGVRLLRPSGKWQARIQAYGECIYLGQFHDINDAIAARKAAEAMYHPFAPKDEQHAR